MVPTPRSAPTSSPTPTTPPRGLPPRCLLRLPADGLGRNPGPLRGLPPHCLPVGMAAPSPDSIPVLVAATPRPHRPPRRGANHRDRAAAGALLRTPRRIRPPPPAPLRHPSTPPPAHRTRATSTPPGAALSRPASVPLPTRVSAGPGLRPAPTPESSSAARDRRRRAADTSPGHSLHDRRLPSESVVVPSAPRSSGAPRPFRRAVIPTARSARSPGPDSIPASPPEPPTPGSRRRSEAALRPRGTGALSGAAEDSRR